MSTTETYAKKKGIRGGHRASTTVLLTDVEGAIEATPPNPENLKDMRVILTEKLQTLKQLDAEIAELAPEDDLDGEIADTDKYNTRIFATSLE